MVLKMRQLFVLKSCLQKMGCTTRGLHNEAVVYGSRNSFPSTLSSAFNSSQHQHLQDPFNIVKQRDRLKPMLSQVNCKHPMYVEHSLVNKLNCLSGLPIEKIDKTITNSTYECPNIGNILIEIETPAAIQNIIPLDTPPAKQIVIESPGTAEEKIANSALRRRRRSMKKHQRKRLRKRTWPQMKKRKFLKSKKKRRIQAAHKVKFQDLAAEFDAMAYIEGNLDTARKHGYKINVFDKQ